jgi:hypothetical protein
MQAGFLRRLSEEELAALVDAQVAVIRHCVAQKYPIVLVETHGEGSTIPQLYREVMQTNFVTITKHDDDGFRGTELRRILQSLAVDALLLMGVNANACVKETAITAKDLGFRIITAEDLIKDCCACCIHTDKFRVWYQDNATLFPPDTSVDEIFSSLAPSH